MSGRRLLWAGLAAAFAAIALALAGGPALLRAAFGLPLVLFVPGYALVCAADPRGRLGAAERLAIAIGTSIAVTVVVGLLLSASPAGLRTESWTAGLGWCAVVASLFALQPTRGLARLRRTRDASASRAPAIGAAVIFVSAAVISLALVTVQAERPVGSERDVERGTVSVMQMWVVPGMAEGGSLVVGLANPTAAAIECYLIVRRGDQVSYEAPVALPPGYAGSVSVPTGGGGSVMFPTQVLLMDAERSVVLRRLSLWPHQSSQQTTTDAEG